MRRLALVTLVSMLALPGAATARARVYSARVVRANAGSLLVRLADGRIVRYGAPRVATASSPRPLLAHVARASDPAGAADFDLRALEPGVNVLVSATSAGVTIGLPGPGAPEQHARGVVSAVAPDGFVLQLPDHTRLRLHTSRRARLQPCQTASVSYHQDLSLLVVDRTHGDGSVARGRGRGHGRGRGARGCAAQSAAGTITALTANAVSIATADGRSLTFKASRRVTGGFAVGDGVDVSYVGHRATEVTYAQRVASGTVSGAGGGAVSIIDGVGGRSSRFATSASPAAGEHAVIVYHRSVGRAVADALYAAASR
jgi:hypothetical protein